MSQHKIKVIAHVFEQYANASHVNAPLQAPQFIADLIADIRPEKAEQTEVAVSAIQALCALLNQHPEYARQLREAILWLLSEHKPISLFLIARHSVFSGFFAELLRRMAHKILPEAVDPSYLIDSFSLFFTKQSDELWIQAVPDSVWDALVVAMRFSEAPTKITEPCRRNLLEAAQVLSYRIAALGLEPELLRNHPELEQHSSPFISQHAELAQFLALAQTNANPQLDPTAEPSAGANIKHILVMLDQCNAVVKKIRRNSTQTGTSIHLTLLLQRMSQQVDRLETLLNIIDDLNCGKTANVEVIQLFKELVYSECHKNDIHEHWQDNVEVMALRVTENASRTGEHYIAANRSEYYALMRSAMGAGIIIAVLAMIKVMLAKQHLAPLTEAILFSLNYGLGFTLIHILHFTVATKQPAMTAAVIAASIDTVDIKSKEMDKLVATIANTTRSQLIAIIGNVVLAIPVAILLSWCIFYVSGEPFVAADKAPLLLQSIDPIHSGALFYAAIAGVCLFLSGLIAGYHDNLAVYNKIPQRLRALRGLQKLLGTARLARVANYVENNLGAMAGNFYFGCLLGGMAAIGVLFGLPFDIRHISFSSAYVGFAAVGLDFVMSWQTIAYTALSLALIGFMNLTVSFGLALYVAMKSRKVRFTQWRLLLGNLATRLNQHPGEFIWPPKNAADQPAPADDAAGPKK